VEIVANFKVLFHNISGGNEENYEKDCKESTKERRFDI